MPGSARHTYGIEFTQCIAVATMPRLRRSPSSIDDGCRPWNVTSTGGSPSISTSKRSPSGPNVHGGSRCSWPMNQLTAATIDRLAADERFPAEPLRGDQARLDHADRRVDRRGRDRDLVRRAQLRVDREAQLVGDHAIDCWKPWPSTVVIMLAAASSGVLPNSMMSRTTSGAA